jgi:hypothetical protein
MDRKSARLSVQSGHEDSPGCTTLPTEDAWDEEQPVKGFHDPAVYAHVVTVPISPGTRPHSAPPISTEVVKYRDWSYIGCSCNPDQRNSGHLCEAVNRKYRAVAWSNGTSESM